MPQRPEVFVSATTADLGSVRRTVREALLTLGCVPVEQTTFPPDGAGVREMLRRRIAECQAVVHVAGEVYGAEPRAPSPGESRRSYTQIEHDIARELGKRLYVFLCAEGFPYDPHAPEDEERRALQAAHRERLQAGDHLYERVATREQLVARVHALQARVEQLSRDLGRARRWLVGGLIVGLVAAGLLGLGLHGLSRRTEQAETQVARVQSELERQRGYVLAVLQASTLPASDDDDGARDDAASFERAIARVAASQGVDAGQVRAGLALFVAAIRGDPTASALDQALAAFAERRYATAAERAGQAADEARIRREAAEGLASRAATEARGARRQEREARTVEAASLLAARRPAQAVEAARGGLAVTPRDEDPRAWAYLQRVLASAEDDAAAISTGDAIAAHQQRAVDANRAALEVFTRAKDPWEWAATQNNLGVTLQQQAATLSGPARTRTLGDAVAAYRAALEVHTRHDHPRDWARTQVNLAAALRHQAGAELAEARGRLLAESLAALRAALAIYDRTATPEGWATARYGLGQTLRVRALEAEGDARAQGLAECAAIYRELLEARPREADPEAWARTQDALALVLVDQAAVAPADDRKRLLGDAVAGFRAALAVRTRGEDPQTWARTCDRLALALADFAEVDPVESAGRELTEAIALHRGALEVLTREAVPREWARIQGNLALALDKLASSAAPSEEVERLVAESVAAHRAATSVLTRNEAPGDWVRIQANLAETLRRHATGRPAAQSAEMLAGAVEAYRAALTLTSRSREPEVWAARTGNLAGTLLPLARHAPSDDERIRLCAEAAASYRALLEVFTRERHPVLWARTQENLAMALDEQASPRGPGSAALLREALAAMRASLQVLTAAEWPDDHAAALDWIDDVERDLARLESGR